MTLVKWNPRRSYLTNFNEWDHFLDNFFGGGWEKPTLRNHWVPAVDIHENNDEYTVTTDLPGLSKKDITINVKDNVLTISGERKYEEKAENDGHYRTERGYGNFNRCFRLPDEIIEDKITAKFKAGVLIVNLPKAEEVKPKDIEIKVS